MARKKQTAAASKRLKLEMTAGAFRDDMLSFVDQHGGRISYTHRSASGFPKLMLVNFGPRSLPTFQLEIRDRGRPEDPLDRDARSRKNLERAHDKRIQDIDQAVKEALVKQKQELAVEWGIAKASDQPAASASVARQAKIGERWSKRSFTDHMAATIGLGDRTVDSIERDGSNVIWVSDGDQTFKVTVSMPRKK